MVKFYISTNTILVNSGYLKKIYKRVPEIYYLESKAPNVFSYSLPRVNFLIIHLNLKKNLSKTLNFARLFKITFIMLFFKYKCELWITFTKSNKNKCTQM